MRINNKMGNITIHDNYVISYTVLCSKKEIIIHTEFRDQGESFEKTEIKFSGVSAYQFKGDNLNSILFSVEETTIEDALQKYHLEFQEGIKYCWLGPWNESPETALQYLRKSNSKAWEISSSYGICGFVIADKIEIKGTRN